MDLSQLLNLTIWTDLSIIWLCFLAFILGLVPLAILFFAVRGMMVVNRTVPRYLKLGQYYSGIVRDQTRKYSAVAAEPVTRSWAGQPRPSDPLQFMATRQQCAAEGLAT